MNRLTFILSVFFLILWIQQSALSFSWLPDDLKLTQVFQDPYTQFPDDLIHLDHQILVLGFSDDSSGVFRVNSMRSTDGGLTFETPIQIDTLCYSGCTTKNVRFAYSPVSEMLVAVYERRFESQNYYHIICSVSTDAGQTWQTPVQINDDSDVQNHFDPVVAINLPTNHIHVAWLDFRESSAGDIYYARSTNGGVSFLSNNKISYGIDPLVMEQTPDIITFASTVAVAYVSSISYTNVIYLTVSEDGGQTFTTNVPVYYQAFAQSMPKLAYSPRTHRLHVAWINTELATPRIACSTSISDYIFMPPVFLSYGLADYVQHPSIAVNFPGDIFVAWNSGGPTKTGDQDIFVAASFNGGYSFTTPQLVSHGPFYTDQSMPLISTPLLRHNINIVWADYREDGLIPDLFSNLHVPAKYDGFSTENFYEAWSHAFSVQRSSDFAFDDDGYSCRFGIQAKAAGELQQTFTELQQGLIDFWFYDGYGSDPIYETTDFTVEIKAELPGSKIGVVRAIGIVNANNSHHYQSYDGSTWQTILAFTRSEGWHHVQIEVGDSGITIQLDADLYFTAQPVYSDLDFQAFDELVFTGGETEGPYYLDNVNVDSSVVGEVLVPALSPTALILLALALGFIVWLQRTRR